MKIQLKPLLGLKIDWLSLPEEALPGFEPSQLAVIINTLLDASLPQIQLLSSDPHNSQRLGSINLSKAPSGIGERESYPDYIHKSGKRVELKGLFVDNPSLKLKRPPTKREPSARLKENVTIEKIVPERDILLIVAVRLEIIEGRCYPIIIDYEVFPMIDCVEARDSRLKKAGGKWFGKMPKVVSNKGQAKLKQGVKLNKLSESDFEKDTNFGKLKRIPYRALQNFLRKHKAI